MNTSLDNPVIFADDTAFEQSFIQGLEQMLDAEVLGAFILVLANATYDARIYEQLQNRLKARFDSWQGLLKDPEQADKQAADDVAVFRRLQETGFENLGLTGFRHAEIWQLQYNPLRSFRPGRNANVRFDALQQPFKPDGFHFNKAFLQREILFEGELLDQPVRLLYNKFPFAPLHGLLLIDPEANKPQLLRQQDHEFIWQWLHSSNEAMPLGVGYNALGAYASVNHQHFQTFVSHKKLPVELGFWQHNGGAAVYPLPCRRFINVDEAWQHLQTLHQVNQPYNLLYRKGEMYCISRRFQGHYEHADWTAGFAWAETMGAITVITEKDFQTLDDALIRQEMNKLLAVS